MPLLPNGHGHTNDRDALSIRQAIVACAWPHGFTRAATRRATARFLPGWCPAQFRSAASPRHRTLLARGEAPVASPAVQAAHRYGIKRCQCPRHADGRAQGDAESGFGCRPETREARVVKTSRQGIPASSSAAMPAARNEQGGSNATSGNGSGPRLLMPAQSGRPIHDIERSAIR
jgi:hypothetical protein